MSFVQVMVQIVPEELEVVDVPQRVAAEPEDETEGTQIISTPLLSLRSLKQSAALPLVVLEPIHLMQGLLEGQVGTKPFVQYG